MNSPTGYYTNMDQDLIEADETIARLTKSNQEFIQKCKNLTRDNVRLTQDLKLSTETCQELAGKVTELTNYKEELENQIESLIKNIHMLRESLDLETSTLEHVRDELKRCETERAEWFERAIEAEKTIERVSKRGLDVLLECCDKNSFRFIMSSAQINKSPCTGQSFTNLTSGNFLSLDKELRMSCDSLACDSQCSTIPMSIEADDDKENVNPITKKKGKVLDKTKIIVSNNKITKQKRIRKKQKNAQPTFTIDTPASSSFSSSSSESILNGSNDHLTETSATSQQSQRATNSSVKTSTPVNLLLRPPPTLSFRTTTATTCPDENLSQSIYSTKSKLISSSSESTSSSSSSSFSSASSFIALVFKFILFMFLLFIIYKYFTLEQLCHLDIVTIQYGGIRVV